MKQIQIRIYPNGQIQAETHGIKGKQCLNYINKIEQMANARIDDSDFTKEYYETEEQLVVEQEQEVKA
jgi:hypothetical protein